MCYILRLHHTLCLPPARNTNSSNLIRNSLTSLGTVSRETVRRLMVHFHIAGHLCCLRFISCLWFYMLFIVLYAVCGFICCLWFYKLFVILCAVCGFIHCLQCLGFNKLFVVLYAVCGFIYYFLFYKLFVVLYAVCGFISCLWFHILFVVL